MERTNMSSLLRSWSMALAIALLASLFVAADWYYYSETRKNLDREFDRRLTALASLAAAEISSAIAPSPASGEAPPALPDSSMRRLERFCAEQEIADILLVREDGITLFALRPDLYPPGEEYPHWKMDYGAIVGALEGRPSATRLHRAPGGSYLKAGYAPAAGGTAFVAVEASAAFLEGLSVLRSILVAATVLSMLGIVLFALFAYRATSSLLRARESLMHAETLASMGRMAAGIAHEIRNPLFIIRSSAERLRDERPDCRKEIDGFIIEEVDRLNGILTDYLLFARNEPMRRLPLDLARTLDRAVRLVGEPLEKAGIVLARDIRLDSAPFAGEEKRLEQALLNVLLNAQQAIGGTSPPGGPGRITISLSLEGGRYRIAVADTGAGIPEKDLERIFEPFWTTKPKGSGLGLAITKRVVEDHGGEIAVRSAPGEGTTVTMLFPAPREGTADAGGQPPTGGEPPETGDAHGQRADR